MTPTRQARRRFRQHPATKPTDAKWGHFKPPRRAHCKLPLPPEGPIGHPDLTQKSGQNPTAWPSKLLRHGHIFRDGKTSWTKQHNAWVRRQRLADPLAHSALDHMLAHLDGLDAQIAALDRQLDEIADRKPWSDPVRWLGCFRGITTVTALGLLAELGDLRRFATARELMSFLGLTPSEHSSGEQRHRGHITETGPRHVRRLLIEAACHYQHPVSRWCLEPDPRTVNRRRPGQGPSKSTDMAAIDHRRRPVDRPVAFRRRSSS